MSSFSDHLEDELLDHVFGNAAYSAPATVYIALYTAAPSDSGGGTEVSGGSYVRKSVANNLTNWPSSSGGAKDNGTEITFVTATASWGTVTHFGIFDAATAGNLLGWAALGTSKPVGNGDTAKFAVGALDLTLA